MSNGRRAYDLLRGYVNQEWERIRGVEDRDAVNELNHSLSIDAIASKRSSAVEEDASDLSPKEWAYKILGVTPTADFTEIRKAFERLNSRADPSKFPAGTPEARQASDIQRRVQQAYAILAEGFDTNEKRFKSLEID